MRTGSLQGHRRRDKQIRLEGRNDLMLHFLVSAGVQLVSDHGAAMAIGEFKELLDSTGSGTGFSFVDLGADKTGLRFAEAATDSAGGAKRLQRLLAEAVSETAFYRNSAIFRNVCRKRRSSDGSAVLKMHGTRQWSAKLIGGFLPYQCTVEGVADRRKFRHIARSGGTIDLRTRPNTVSKVLTSRGYDVRGVAIPSVGACLRGQGSTVVIFDT